jgi:hypothetical protein
MKNCPEFCTERNTMILSPVKQIGQKYGIRPETIRLWIRTEQIAGTRGKPALVDEASLVDHIKKSANGPLLKLISSRNPGHGGHVGEL